MEWIDVNKEMPNFKQNRYVIVYMPKSYIKIDVQTVYNNGKGGSKFDEGWGKGEGTNEISHWMPLPNKPNDLNLQ